MKEWKKEFAELLRQLQPDIDDDFRANEEDDVPGMQVTFATTDGVNWTHQTGDNSFTGPCYSHEHWAVAYLYRDSDVEELAAQAVSELEDLYAEANPGELAR